MRRFHDSQRSSLTKGLRRHYQEVPDNWEFFDLYNFKPTPRGLVPYEPVVEVLPQQQMMMNGIGLTAEGNLDWPFPQMFFGKRYTIIADRLKVYLANRYDFTAGLLELELYDADNPSQVGSITEGGPWSFVDMQETWLLTNGACTVFCPGKEAMIGETVKAYVSDNVAVQTAAYFKGRVVFGGLNFKQFWNSTWQANWTAWATAMQDTNLSLTWPRGGETATMPMDENFIWWSQIGGGDLLFLFFPTLAQNSNLSGTGYGSSRPFVRELWQRGDQGFMPIDGIGTVRKLLPLGEALIAYSDEAVVALYNVTDPAPGLGQRVLYHGGVTGRAVAGDLKNHCFVDQGGNLVKISADLSVEVQGYREFLWPLAGTNLMMHHSSNPQDVNDMGEWYICDGSTTYVFNGELYETGQIIHSAFYFNGQTVGLTSYYDEDCDEGRIGIDVANFQVPGYKQLDWFFLDFEETVRGSSSATVKLAVDYRFSNRDSYTTTPYKLFNNQGGVYSGTAGQDFRFRVKVDDYAKLKRIWGYSPTVKFVDQRFRKSAPITSANR